MKVIDLIIQLQKQDQNLEVVLDKTNNGADFFSFKGINAVEPVEIDGIGSCVMLTPFDYNESDNLN